MNFKVESISSFLSVAKQQNPIISVAFQAIDLTDYEDVIFENDFEDCLFLGCEMSTKAQKKLIKDWKFVLSHNVCTFSSVS